MRASFRKYTLNFIRPGGTSRGVLTQKDTYLICLQGTDGYGIGEAGLFRGLSWDDRPDYEAKLTWACQEAEGGNQNFLKDLREYPSIVFGLEQALRSLESKNPYELFPSGFLSGEPIPINGLIWMGSPDYIRKQIREKIETGFGCLKLKIGSLDFEQELQLLREIRATFGKDILEIRVDANGAFTAGDALLKLEALSKLELHSVEQPIAPGQWEPMAELCKNTPLPIALDEELIGCLYPKEKFRLLKALKPQYIILKPSLIGGFSSAEQWIEGAESLGIGWWVTSALESNIGLNAIAQWTASLGVQMPQGLGTGSLFSNNFDSPLEADQGKLWYRPEKKWDDAAIKHICT